MPRKTTRPTFYRDKECPTCHCFFTSQGLAGHLRFAHSKRYERDVGETILAFQKQKALVQAYCNGAELPSYCRDEVLRWLTDWQRLLMYGEMLGIQFTQADFKHYLVARMVGERQRTTAGTGLGL